MEPQGEWTQNKVPDWYAWGKALGSRRGGGKGGVGRWGFCASLHTPSRLRLALQTSPGQLPHQLEEVLQEGLW